MPTPDDYAQNKLTTIQGNQPTSQPTEPPAPKPSRKPGPKTAEGKARSSKNATRHGLAGSTVVLPSEDMNLFRQFSKEMVDSLNPETSLERGLAQTVANGYWRLKRFLAVEEGMLALGNHETDADSAAGPEELRAMLAAAKAFRANSHAFATLSIYEQRIQRGIEKAMKQLLELQTSRGERRKAEMREILHLRELNKMKNLPYDATEDGFVYSNAEIEIEAHRRGRREEADLARELDYDYAAFLKRVA